MKALVEEYGNVVMVILAAGLLLAIIATIRPLYEMSEDGGHFEILRYEPEDLELPVTSVETKARTVSPMELINESYFNLEEWTYRTTEGNNIYYQNENLDNLIFVSRYSDSGIFNYSNIVLGNFGAYVDEVTIILNRDSKSEIGHSLVVIKE